ncbi:hypothetical protein C8Q77DRAFT_1274293 [Trametes polyzona]|nr:hypothetical protein C8Q77DRAFT_1274293 [Trametes polyzona]
MSTTKPSYDSPQCWILGAFHYRSYTPRGSPIGNNLTLTDVTVPCIWGRKAIHGAKEKATPHAQSAISPDSGRRFNDNPATSPLSEIRSDTQASDTDRVADEGGVNADASAPTETDALRPSDAMKRTTSAHGSSEPSNSSVHIAAPLVEPVHLPPSALPATHQQSEHYTPAKPLPETDCQVDKDAIDNARLHVGDRNVARPEPEAPVGGQSQAGINDESGRANIRSHVHADVRPSIHADVRPSIHADVRPSVQGDVCKDVHPDLHGDVHSNVEPNVHPNTGSDIHPDYHLIANVSLNVPPAGFTSMGRPSVDIGSDIPPPAHQNTQAGGRPHVSRSATAEAGPSVVTLRAVQDEQTLLVHDTPSDVQANVPRDLLIHVPADARSDVRSNVHAHAQYDVAPNVHAHVQYDVAPNVHAHLQYDVLPDVSEDGRRDVSSRTDADAQHNNPSNVREDPRPNVHSDVRADSRPPIHSGVHDDSSRDTVVEGPDASVLFDLDDVRSLGADDLDEERAVGRISNDSRNLLDAGYAEVLQKAKDTATATGLAVSQVFDQWFTAHSTRARNRDNKWNLYGTYFAHNMAKEISYLPEEPDFVDNSAITRAMCYTTFQKRHGDHALEILQKHRSLQELRQGQSHTVAQRRADFNKAAKKMKDLMDTFQNVQGFSSVCALVGNVVNSDTALAVVHETKDAAGFFETRCRTDHDGVISHLKAHVYHTVSLEHVSLAFPPDQPGTKQPAPSSIPGPAKGKARAAAVAKMTIDSNTKGRDNDADGDGDSDDEDEENRGHTDDSDDDGLLTSKGRVEYIKKRFQRSLSSIGKDTLISQNKWPWLDLLNKLASNAIIIRNWPEGIPLPPRPLKHGEVRKHKPVVYQRGVSDCLVEALRHPRHPLHFEIHKGSVADLVKSRSPIVYGAPPGPKSKASHARRMFYDGTTDTRGEARQASSTKAGAGKGDPADITSTESSDSEQTPMSAESEQQLSDPPAKQPSSTPRVRSPPVVAPPKFRQVHVVIPTPKKKRQQRVAPTEVIDLDCDDLCDSPSPSPTLRGAVRGKKRAQGNTPGLVLPSEEDVPSAESSSKPWKGKERAADVGMLPRSNATPRRVKEQGEARDGERPVADVPSTAASAAPRASDTRASDTDRPPKQRGIDAPQSHDVQVDPLAEARGLTMPAPGALQVAAVTSTVQRPAARAEIRTNIAVVDTQHDRYPGRDRAGSSVGEGGGPEPVRNPYAIPAAPIVSQPPRSHMPAPDQYRYPHGAPGGSNNGESTVTGSQYSEVQMHPDGVNYAFHPDMRGRWGPGPRMAYGVPEVAPTAYSGRNPPSHGRAPTPEGQRVTADQLAGEGDPGRRGVAMSHSSAERPPQVEMQYSRPAEGSTVDRHSWHHAELVPYNDSQDHRDTSHPSHMRRAPEPPIVQWHPGPSGAPELYDRPPLGYHRHPTYYGDHHGQYPPSWTVRHGEEPPVRQGYPPVGHHLHPQHHRPPSPSVYPAPAPLPEQQVGRPSASSPHDAPESRDGSAPGQPGPTM